ncbi:MAG: undecaprenyl-diphosphate phosphatase [Alphaproteobacteria bacterium]|nr:undecaprenyl-diphosphate phosphatase [Alphaproteobacteria bacterium]
MTDSSSFLIAILLGIVEGLTEFIPVSSTGHLILLIDLLQFQGPPGKVFEIAIQFGAILAVCWLYRARFWSVLTGMTHEAASRRFVVNILLGFLPAAVIGVLAHGFIKSVLFSPWVVASTLVVGGFAILWIERHLPAVKVETVEQITPLLALKIGFCQTVAMIPGVSRSGATIMGALLLGTGRKAATEFSFFLAVPTMLGATVYDLWKNRAALDLEGSGLIAAGFIAAFFAAMLVVRGAIAFISRHGFAPFAWYRIVIGGIMLAILMLR